MFNLQVLMRALSGRLNGVQPARQQRNQLRVKNRKQIRNTARTRRADQYNPQRTTKGLQSGSLRQTRLRRGRTPIRVSNSSYGQALRQRQTKRKYQ